MAYTGYTVSNLLVTAENAAHQVRSLGRINLADADSCDRFQKWWKGEDTKSKDLTRNGVKLADGVVTKGAPAGTAGDEQRMKALDYYHVERPTADEVVKFSVVTQRFDTVDVFFGGRTAGGVSPAQSLFDRKGDLSGDELAAEMAKLSPSEKKKFFTLLANE